MGEMIKDLLIEYLVGNFSLIFLAVVFIFMTLNRKNTHKHLANIYHTLAVAITLSIVTTLENFTARNPDYLLFRTILSYIGFVLRPSAIMFLIFVFEQDKVKRSFICIPELLNIIIMAFCFFNKTKELVFYFDENYVFNRGVIGYFFMVVTGLYYIYFLYSILKRYTNGQRHEFVILIVCAIFALIACLFDILLFGDNVNIAIVICSMFYYIFLNSDLSGHDALTLLENRESFYEDCKYKTNSITGVITIDMNGLKEANDTKGHSYGDECLVTIAKALKEYNSRNINSYRVGGDEFMIIFRNVNKDEILNIIKNIKEKVHLKNVEIAYGLGYRNNNETILDLCKMSDAAMYEDKKKYYESKGL